MGFLAGAGKEECNRYCYWKDRLDGWSLTDENAYFYKSSKNFIYYTYLLLTNKKFCSTLNLLYQIYAAEEEGGRISHLSALLISLFWEQKSLSGTLCK